MQCATRASLVRYLVGYTAVHCLVLSLIPVLNNGIFARDESMVTVRCHRCPRPFPQNGHHTY